MKGPRIVVRQDAGLPIPMTDHEREALALRQRRFKSFIGEALTSHGEVPRLVAECVAGLRLRARTEGLFRVPPNKKGLELLIEQAKNGRILIEGKDMDAHLVAGLLTWFLRDGINEPLLKGALENNETLEIFIADRLPHAHVVVLLPVLELLSIVTRTPESLMPAVNIAKAIGIALVVQKQEITIEQVKACHAFVTELLTNAESVISILERRVGPQAGRSYISRSGSSGAATPLVPSARRSGGARRKPARPTPVVLPPPSGVPRRPAME
jgi:hypothetical protein